METNNTKTWQVVLGIVIIILLAIWLFKMPNREVVMPAGDSGEEVVGNDEEETTKEMCYIWNTEAGDSATLRLITSVENMNASGTLNWIPAEKDRKTGTFEGKLISVGRDTMGGSVDAVWKVSAEGMTYDEQLILKYDETSANVGFGMMEDRGDGTYVYSDPTNLSYEPNLTRTDCEDEAVR